MAEYFREGARARVPLLAKNRNANFTVSKKRVQVNEVIRLYSFQRPFNPNKPRLKTKT